MNTEHSAKSEARKEQGWGLLTRAAEAEGDSTAVELDGPDGESSGVVLVSFPITDFDELWGLIGMFRVEGYDPHRRLTIQGFWSEHESKWMYRLKGRPA